MARGAVMVALALSLTAATAPAAAAAKSPAAVQYELGDTIAADGGDGVASGEQIDYGEERPAGVALGSLDNGEVILVLTVVLLLTALLVGFALHRGILPRSRRAAVLALAGLTLTAVLLAVLPAGGAQRKPPSVPKVFYGMIPQLERPAADYKRMKSIGVDSVRFPIPWDAVERRQGVFYFSLIDAYVERAARAGLEIFPAVNATPVFYGVNCSAADCFRSLPSQTAQQKAAWKELLKRLVDRYGPDGNFWNEHPDVPKRPIRIWQIWNEWNFVFFTEPRSPRLYAELVKISSAAIKRRDPGAKIILGGLFAHPKRSQGIQATSALNQLYKVRGIKSRFDGVALHPYAKDASDLRPDINAIRRVMKRNGDARTPFYMTEIGWGSARDTAFEKGLRGQARELSQAFTLLRNMRRAARIQRVFWFSWEDVSGSCNFCDSTGLIRANGRAKPAYGKYRSFAKG